MAFEKARVYVKNLGNEIKAYASANKYPLIFTGAIGGYMAFRLLSGQLFSDHMDYAGVYAASSDLNPLSDTNHAGVYPHSSNLSSISDIGSPDISRASCPTDGNFSLEVNKEEFHPNDWTVLNVHTANGDTISGGIYKSENGVQNGLNTIFQETVTDKCGDDSITVGRWGDPSKYHLYKYGEHTIFVRSDFTGTIYEKKVTFSP